MTPLEEEEIAGAINDLEAAFRGNLTEAGYHVNEALKILKRLVEPQDTAESVKGP